MKKILFFLLFTVSIYGQTLQNPTFGIVTEKNNATDNTPAYFVTSQTDGVHKKTPAALVAKVAIVNDSLATKENIANKSDSYTTSSSTTYASTKAIVDGLATKQNTLTNPITGTGTTNTIPKFTASGTVENSNATSVGSIFSINGTLDSNGLVTIGKITGSTDTVIIGGVSGVKNLKITDGVGMMQLYSSTGSENKSGFYTKTNMALFAGSNNSTVSPTGNGILISSSGRTMVGTTTDNGIDKLQVNGTISANAGTTANQVVVKSQLDGKVSLTGNETIAGNKTLSGTTTLNETIIREGYKLKFTNGVMYQSSVGTNALTDNRTVSFPDASGTVALVETVRPYKVYTALLSQTGTSAPTATVLENTLGGAVVWTRSGLGEYRATLNSAFVFNKTTTMTTGGLIGGGFFINSQYVSGNYVTTTTRTTLNTLADDLLTGTTIEIRVYN